MTRMREINVYITGMGPYPDGRGGHIDNNTSYVVSTLLPATLDPNTSKNPSPNRINILRPQSYVKTEYSYVRQFCKTLHREHAHDVDVFIHLGEARGRPFVSIERAAYKQGMSSVWWGPEDEKGYYTIPDDAGLTAADAGPCPWDGAPMGLRSSLDIDAVSDGAKAILQTWYQFGKNRGINVSNTGETTLEGTVERLSVPSLVAPIDIIPTSEGGPYLCGFINYESLANCYISERTPNVLFCHVPGEADPVSLHRTGDAVLAIVVSAANQAVRGEKREIKAW
ncbi:hypothetical protein GQ53DRAFT_818880 [Thozetella sp. PMI_491]|nr:hypothetical protein GQ53DRAFT_818880 [Thozetella sp. PMI_491]